MQRNVSVVFAFIFFFGLPTVLLAQSFQHELEYDHSKITANSSSGTTAANSISYSYFFSEVQNLELPLAEMEFGTRISSIGLGFSNRDTENRELTTLATGGSNSELVSVFGEYKHESTGWFAGGSFGDGNTESGVNQENRNYGVNVGKYLFQNTTLTLGYSERKSDSDNQFALVPSFLLGSCGWQPDGTFIACGALTYNTVISDTNSEIEAVTLSGRHLQEIAGYYFAFGVHYKALESTTKSTNTVLTSPVTTSSTELSADANSYGVDITGYWSKRLSAKLSYEKTENDFNFINDANQFGLSLEYFFMSNFSLSFDYSKIRVKPYRPPVLVFSPVVTVVPRFSTYSQFRNYSPSRPNILSGTVFDYTPSSLLNGADQETYSLHVNWRF
jgi:hypothetical protein